MTDADFPEMCRRVCAERGWKLLRSGVEVQLDDGRHQLVELELAQSEEDEIVRLYTTIGSVTNLSPVRLTIALRMNAELAHGAFAVKDDHLIMVDTLLIRSVDDAQFAGSVQFLAETADYYEQAIFDTDDH